VRQTSRKLKTRINEDKNDINKRAITCLSFLNIDYNLNIILMNTKILDERYIGKRLVSEVLNIKMQNNGLNLKSDTELLHHAYTNIINKL